MPVKTRAWDVAEMLDTPERIARYLEAAFEDGDSALIAAAIGDAARAHGSGVFVTLVFCLTACVGGLGERAIEVEFHPSPDASQWSTWRDGEVRSTPPPISGEIWERRLASEQMEDRPAPELIRRAHPRGAIEQGEVGAAILEGRVLEDGSLTWRVLSVSSLG